MSATASKTAKRSADVTNPVFDEPLIIYGTRVHTSDKGFHHDANYGSVLGNVGLEIKKVTS